MLSIDNDKCARRNVLSFMFDSTHIHVLIIKMKCSAFYLITLTLASTCLMFYTCLLGLKLSDSARNSIKHILEVYLSSGGMVKKNSGKTPHGYLEGHVNKIRRFSS